MLTVRGAGPVPVLTFDAGPDGAPPPVLQAGADGDLARRPAGGEPMLVLRRRADVLRCLTDTTHFGMAGVTGSGKLTGCPLTGAEMQSPDGGLLNMNPPLLREYRQRINGLFTHRDAEATRPAIEALAADLCASLGARRTVDAITGFAGPFTAGAVCWAMGIPREDWEQILKYSRVAFAVVPSAAAVSEVAAAWEDLYGYYEPIVAAKRAQPDRSLTSQLIAALDGLATSQIVHVIATVSNGFGAILPVLAVAIADVAERPQIIAACQRGERTWAWIAAHLLSHRALFPVALPRVALLETRLGGRLVPEGMVVLPSLIAAAHDPCGPPPLNIAFGAGPHFCPGAALTRVWLATALAAFFGSFPAARPLSSLEWQPGTLSFPREIRLALR
ncbi:MAG: cytochrome P450 [Gemmatimonadota bacterium]